LELRSNLPDCQTASGVSHIMATYWIRAQHVLVQRRVRLPGGFYTVAGLSVSDSLPHYLRVEETNNA